MRRFIGADKHIVPDLADDLHRHIFMFRILHGDEVRMVAGSHFPAVDAATTALAAAFAENGLRQQLSQGVFSGSLRAGDQIEVGNVPFRQTFRQILFQPVIAQQCLKGHSFPPYPKKLL